MKHSRGERGTPCHVKWPREWLLGNFFLKPQKEDSAVKAEAQGAMPIHNKDKTTTAS